LAKEVLGFDADALNILKSYDWPGNYNQFKKIINELVMNTSSSYIKASAVSKLLKKENSTSHPNSDLMELSITDKTLEDINLDIIQRVLSEENGNQSSTAKRLGISRTTLWRMLQKISNPD
jgi:transcriptional regulator with PAS, ATPase and Fis domain